MTEMPASFSEPQSDEGERKTGARSIRSSICPQARREYEAVAGPSSATIARRPMPAALETIAVAPGHQISSDELLLATEKGTSIHEAFRILLPRPDLKAKVGPHCRLTDQDVEALALQAQGLQKQLASLGFPILHVEQPLEVRLSDGGALTAIIDLLAEGEAGHLIVDHKSGPVPDHERRFASYWPQLSAYADAIDALGGKPVVGVSIFWTNSGELTAGYV